MLTTIELGDIPPTYRIDLSRPPAERYIEVAKKYRNELISLITLFDGLVESVAPNISLQWVRRVARLFLRRVYSAEETEEIRGISAATGIEMYLIVSLNVLLDVLMGCTSGAARAQDNATTTPRMLHFRTLDWGMDALRRVLVQFKYVRGPDYETVLATNITYIGFVGVLTGVRRGLSVSLNFRPNHDSSGWLGDLRFYGSHVLVMLGLRRSISSILRQFIIPGETAQETWLGRALGVLVKRRRRMEKPTLRSICQEVMRTPSTAAYLVLCDGTEASVIEKDHRTARIDSSSSFIVATNSDLLGPELRSNETTTDVSFGAALTSGETITMADFIEDSRERRACMQAHWDKKVARARRSAHGPKPTSATKGHDPLRRTRSSRSRVPDCPVDSASTSVGKENAEASENHEVAATPEEIIRWTATYPTTNEMTHFAAVMDPTSGKVIWIQRFRDPLPFEQI